MKPEPLKFAALQQPGAWGLGIGRGGSWENSGGSWVGADFFIHPLLCQWLRSGRVASGTRSGGSWVGADFFTNPLLCQWRKRARPHSAISRQHKKKLFTLLDLFVSSLRRGHANLLCIVPILTDDPEGHVV